MTGLWSSNEENRWITLEDGKMGTEDKSTAIKNKHKIMLFPLEDYGLADINIIEDIPVKDIGLNNSITDVFKKVIYYIKKSVDVAEFEEKPNLNNELETFKYGIDEEMNQIRKEISVREKAKLNSNEDESQQLTKKYKDEEGLLELYERFILLEQQLITINNVLK